MTGEFPHYILRVKVGYSMDLQEQLKNISSYTSKLLRKKFGRGPEMCTAWFGHEYIVVVIGGFMSPIEEVLVEHDQEDTVTGFRSFIIETIVPELKEVFESTLKQHVAEIYHDWNFANNSGIIMAIMTDSLSDEDDPTCAAYPERLIFEQEIRRVGQALQKVPDEIISYRISPKIYVVIRIGILIQIEKALIVRGYEKLLRLVKNDVEKHYFRHDGRFDHIFQRRLADLFVAWNFQLDKSLMCFIMK